MSGSNDSQVSAGRVMRQLILVAGLVVSVLLIVFIIYPWGGPITSILLFLVMVITLVRAYSLGHRYRCANCGAVFKVPVAVDFFTGGGIGKNPDGTYHNWKSLTCPDCGQRSRAVVVTVSLDEREAGDARAAAEITAGRGSGDEEASGSGRSRNAKRRKKRG